MQKDQKIYINLSVLKTLIYILVDFVIIFACYILGIESQTGSITANDFLFILGVAVFKIIVSLIFGVYKALTNHTSFIEAIQLGAIAFFTNVVAAVVNKVFLSEVVTNISITTYILITSIEILLVVASRCATIVVKLASSIGQDGKRTMIIGAGAAGKIAYDEIHNNKDLDNNIVCFFDKDPNKYNHYYLGKKVYGPDEELLNVIQKLNIEEVIIAIASISRKDLLKLTQRLSEANVVVKRLPILSEMDINKSMAIKEVSLAELLGREQISFDTTDIAKFIANRRVLVTGAGGSIGSELTRQIFSYNPSMIILFDIYENSTYDIQQDLVREIKRTNSDIELVTIIGSTYNEFRVEEIFAKYEPEIIFHAAAYKHVPLMEDSPVEAIRTNVIGTYNVAKMASKYKAIKMTLVSTDKAVRPTNTMGATKAFAEMIIRYFDSISPDTSFSAVRFGNVLGSNGSVIPLFKRQILEGGPVTVTHKDIIRFFMTIPEAVSLILQSATYAKGGEIFILDMGEPVKILTLAENVIKQCGLVPYKDIDIVFTGLRHGEKLYEELLLNVTEHEKTDNDKIFIEKRRKVQPIEEEIDYIKDALFKTDNKEIKSMLRHVVTSYTNYKEFNAAHKCEN